MGVNEYLQIGTRIKRHRIDKGFSQKQMALLLDIPVSTYSNYENNNREPNLAIINKIADILGITVENLLFSESGIMDADAAAYLITLAGFGFKNNADGTYIISEIEENKIVRQCHVSNQHLKEIVSETSNFVAYLIQKLFSQK